MENGYELNLFQEVTCLKTHLFCLKCDLLAHIWLKYLKIT